MVIGCLLVAPRATAADADKRLIDAVRTQDRELIRALVAAHVDVNVPQADGATALHWAMHWADLESASLLIRSGARVDASNEYGVTPLMLACGNGHAAAVTSGAEGAVLVTPEGEALRGTLAAAGAYPVGSGDAFLAGLVVALHREERWSDALRAALGSAAANAEVPGAGRLDRDRAAALAKRARVANA